MVHASTEVLEVGFDSRSNVDDNFCSPMGLSIGVADFAGSEVVSRVRFPLGPPIPWEHG